MKNAWAPISLPRGGCLVDTPEGTIQFGVPPETIKDSMAMSLPVPRTYVLPRILFNWDKGINVADIEFPIYYNFFIKKRKVSVVGTDAQIERVRIALQEAVFGPEQLDLSRDVDAESDDAAVPDIRPEIEFYRAGLSLEDMVEFHPFRDGVVRVGSVAIGVTEEDDFAVAIDGRHVGDVPGRVSYTAKYDIGARLVEPFRPPRFGVTCLGPSHGFDPADNTSGFIIWLNQNGIMIDPPVNSTEWLESSNVNPKFIDSIILTHCHADHDAGTFQKILEEGRVTVYSTRTVMESFLRKYSAFSGEPAEYLETLFTFHPVCIDRPFYLHGGEFLVAYSLHSIPTFGFRLQFQDKSFVYSSDHQADPTVQRKLLDDGVIDETRFAQLQSFPWESDVIYHESGIPPLHTPVSYLSSLPVDVQHRTVVYHIAKKDFPPDTDLTLATFGMENTLYFDTSPPPYEEVYRLLDVLKHLDFLGRVSVEKVQEFLGIVERRLYRRGDVIIRRGTPGSEFFIMVSGNAGISSDGLVREKNIGAFEYFGEVALLTGALRTADIVARSDVELLAIEKNRFLDFIAGTDFEDVLKRLTRNRNDATWNVLATAPAFAKLTDYQRMWLESVLVPRAFDGETTLLREGEEIPGLYVILDGEVTVTRSGAASVVIGPGDLVGSMEGIQRGRPSRWSFTSRGAVDTVFMNLDDTQRFLDRNPGVSMRLAYRY